jgi:hypothetical protein
VRCDEIQEISKEKDVPMRKVLGQGSGDRQEIDKVKVTGQVGEYKRNRWSGNRQIDPTPGCRAVEMESKSR